MLLFGELITDFIASITTLEYIVLEYIARTLCWHIEADRFIAKPFVRNVKCYLVFSTIGMINQNCNKWELINLH